MTEPTIAARQPAAVDVTAGETYYWCSCGRSNMQPFCDGSHEGTSFQPRAFTAEKSETVYFCQCKHSGKGVLCDGTHDKLP